MQPDFEKSAAAMVAGTHKAIEAAVAPLLKRIEELEARKPEKGEKGDVGERGPEGPSGVGVLGAFRDHKGVLILTLSDGRTQDVGDITGPRGFDGEKGDVGERGEIGPQGERGVPGYSLNAFDANVSDDGRTVLLSFADEAERFEVEMKFPVPLYRGVFREGEQYEAGDMVTWGGSLWHCSERTAEKPDEKSKDGAWRIAVKKGRDGKDAKNG